jgi:hypothetical protein
MSYVHGPVIEKLCFKASMKKLIGLYVLVVVVGVLSSLAISEKVTEETFKLYSGVTMNEMDYSLTLENSIAVLEAFENNNEIEVYRSSCMQINLSLKALELYSGNIEGMQKVKTDATISKGNAMLSNLEQSGMC